MDRLWPRGLSRENAQIDAWEKKLAPTTELRKWFDHREDRFDEFRQRYREELADKTDIRESLLKKAGSNTITLLYGARARNCNHATILREFLEVD